MKSLLLLPFLFFSVPVTLHAQDADTNNQLLEDTNADFRSRFTNLSDEEKKTYFSLMQDIRKLFSQKRIFEALDKIDDAEKIIQDHPGLINFRAACYVEFRAFDKAKEQFAIASRIAPENISVRFNSAELEFVTKNWNSALTQFKSIEKKLLETTQKSSYLYLIQFKILLCHISLKNEEEFQKYLNLYDYTEDSPYYYYANATKEFRDDNTEGAQAWLQRAARIFGKQGLTTPWEDSLIEYGYIKSFYGNELPESASQSNGN